MKIVIGYDGSMRSRAAAAMLREQGHIVSAAYVTASSELPAELESKAASDGLFITAVYGDDSTTEGVISALCGHMKAYGFGAAATGHIARVSRDEKVTVDGENGEKQTVIKPCGAPRIAIAVDVPSDESAKLGLLSAETVAKLVLPLGELGAGELAEYAKAHSIHADAAPDAVPVPTGSVGSFRLSGLVFQRGEAPDPTRGGAMHLCHLPVKVGAAEAVESHIYIHQHVGYGMVADVIFITAPSYAEVGERVVVYDNDGNVMLGGRVSALLG